MSKIISILEGKWGNIELDIIAKSIQKLTDTEYNPFLLPDKMSAWIDFLHNLKHIDYSYGGYLEDRSNLWKGHYHENGKTVHLGVDFNVKANTLVFLPCDGILVELYNDSDQTGGWGGKATFECKGFYLTFAHMKNINLLVGSKYVTGTIVGKVAEPEYNGGWYEHLHLQCSREFDSERDAYSKFYHGIEKDFLDPFEVIL